MNKKLNLLLFCNIILILLFLSWYFFTPKIESLENNARYIASASAQSIAALIAIIFVIYSFKKEDIPNYEVIFRSIFPEIMNEYSSKDKIKKILTDSAKFVLFFIIIIPFLTNNIYSLIFWQIILIITIILAIKSLVDFFNEGILNNSKSKFFDVAHDFLRDSKNDYKDIFPIFEEIINFKINSDNKKYETFQVDLEKFDKLLLAIFYNYIKKLDNKNRIYDSEFLGQFKKIIGYLFKRKKVHLLENTNLIQLFSDSIIKEYKKLNLSSHDTKPILNLLNLTYEAIKEMTRTSNEEFFYPVFKIYFTILESLIIEKPYKHDEYFKKAHKKLFDFLTTLNYDWYYDILRIFDKIGLNDEQKLRYLKDLKESYLIEFPHKFSGLDKKHFDEEIESLDNLIKEYENQSKKL
ncbi:MAG: hypothetical protein U9R34_03075 [Nanoarchaeota archaeon]|nr:hypothetical protein [Nanoarchaeota archaeon]